LNLKKLVLKKDNKYMAYCHRHGDSRACGATTIVTGQNFVKVDGQLWSVNGDPDSHGGGALSTTHPWLTINGIGIIVQGNSAAADSLCLPLGGAHCAPSATGFDNLIDVG
jgi:uncharacterized Zn-binding protein involved in type VI secretion